MAILTLPANTDGTAFDLLTQVEGRLLAKIPEFNAGNCFITDEPLPPDNYNPQGGVTCTICLLDGRFDKGLYAGGAANQLAEESDLVVTLLTRTKLDQPPRSKFALLNEERGILTKYKPRLLAAILVDDLAANILSPWNPLRKTGEPFLRDAIMPSRSQGPMRVSGSDWLGLSLHFDIVFDWQLREEIPPSG